MRCCKSIHKTKNCKNKTEENVEEHTIYTYTKKDEWRKKETAEETHSYSCKQNRARNTYHNTEGRMYNPRKMQTKANEHREAACKTQSQHLTTDSIFKLGRKMCMCNAFHVRFIERSVGFAALYKHSNQSACVDFLFLFFRFFLLVLLKLSED